jgi:hypothetical protein
LKYLEARGQPQLALPELCILDSSAMTLATLVIQDFVAEAWERRRDPQTKTQLQSAHCIIPSKYVFTLTTPSWRLTLPLTVVL